eukprot:361043-Pyramimonas_sp.AAC.1
MSLVSRPPGREESCRESRGVDLWHLGLAVLSSQINLTSAAKTLAPLRCPPICWRRRWWRSWRCTARTGAPSGTTSGCWTRRAARTLSSLASVRSTTRYGNYGIARNVLGVAAVGDVNVRCAGEDARERFSSAGPLDPL